MKKSILSITLLTIVTVVSISGLAYATHYDHTHEDLAISPEKGIYSVHDELTFMLTPDSISNPESDYVRFVIREGRSTSNIAGVYSNHAINGTFSGSITLSEYDNHNVYDGTENMHVYVRYDGKDYKQSFRMEHTDPQVDALEGIIDALQKQNKILSTLYTNFWNQALAVGDKKGYDRGYSEGVAAGMASCLN